MKAPTWLTLPVAAFVVGAMALALGQSAGAAVLIVVIAAQAALHALAMHLAHSAALAAPAARTEGLEPRLATLERSLAEIRTRDDARELAGKLAGGRR